MTKLQLQKTQRYTTMKIHTNPAWISANVQELLEPSLILLTKSAAEDIKECDIFKIKMCRNPELADSDTYEINIATFENGKPEKFLALMKTFKTAIDRTGTTSVSGRMN